MGCKKIIKIILFYLLIITPLFPALLLHPVHARRIRTDNSTLYGKLQQEISSLGYSEKESQKVSFYISNIFPELKKMDKTVKEEPKNVIDTLISEIVNSVKKAGSGDPTVKNSDLLKVLSSKKANCIGYTQLFYVTAKTLGLDVDILAVDSNHVVSRVKLGKDKYAMIDLISRDYTNSNPTVIEVKNWSQRYKLKNPKSSTWESNTQKYNFVRVLDNNQKIKSLLLTNKGIKLIKEGELSDGVNYLNRSLTLDSYNATAYNNLGYAFVKQKQSKYEKAIRNFKKAVNLNPGYSLAYSNLANAYEALGKYEEALEKAQKAVKLNPNSANAWVTSGVIKYYHLGKKSEGIADVKKGLQYNSLLYDSLPPEIKNEVKDYYMRELFPN